MPQISSITVTEEQLRRIKATMEHEKYGLSTFMQIVLNDYFSGKGGNSVLKRDFIIFMGYPFIIALLLWVVFMQSGITWVFYAGLITAGLLLATTFYVIDKYKDDLKGEK